MGAFSFLLERLGENPPGFDKFVRNKFGQPKAGPVARKRAGVGCMDAPNNPTLSARNENCTLTPVLISGGFNAGFAEVSAPQRIYCVSGGKASVLGFRKRTSWYADRI